MHRHCRLRSGNTRGAAVHRRRGATLVLVTVSGVALLGAAALSIDVGRLYLTRNELQRAADAAAMAGTSAYLSDSAWNSAQSDGSWSLSAALSALIDARAQNYASLNHTLNQATLLASTDIVKGYFDFDHPSNALDTTGGHRFNAVEVTVRRTTGSANGPVPFFFARILGMNEGNVVARAVAAVDDRFSAYTPPGPTLIPFTLNESVYNQMLASGPDQFSYDQAYDVVVASTDGVREIRLFPWSNQDAGGGNFGTLNIGVPNQGTTGLIDQITNGITPAAIESEIGTPTLTFVNASGAPVTYTMSGNPGLSGAVGSALQARTGDVVGFFLHTSVAGNGSNTEYTIVDLRFGRIMHVDLTGNPNARRLVIQPVTYSGGGVQTSPDAPSSNGQLAVISLVR
ncbi:MAG TPA: TadG family pilus assembly protein [Phycisphaerae bacterium]|jgi:hypothetical protein